MKITKCIVLVAMASLLVSCASTQVSDQAKAETTRQETESEQKDSVLEETEQQESEAPETKAEEQKKEVILEPLEMSEAFFPLEEKELMLPKEEPKSDELSQSNIKEGKTPLEAFEEELEKLNTAGSAERDSRGNLILDESREIISQIENLEQKELEEQKKDPEPVKTEETAKSQPESVSKTNSQTTVSEKMPVTVSSEPAVKTPAQEKMPVKNTSSEPAAKAPAQEKMPVTNTSSEKPQQEMTQIPEKNIQKTETQENEVTAGKNTEENAPVIIKPKIPSRDMKMQKNQFLEVSYPGSGWIYLGDDTGRESFSYMGRKIGSTETVFTLRSKLEGEALLHFYKNDALTGTVIDDYLKIIVQGKSTTNDRVKAPSYALVVPPKPQRKAAVQTPLVENTKISSASHETDKAPETQKTNITQNQEQKQPSIAKASAKDNLQDFNEESGSKTVIQNTQTKAEIEEDPDMFVGEAEVEDLMNPSETKSSVNLIPSNELNSSDQILELANKCFSEGKYKETLAHLDDFFEKATTRIDEGLFLKGRTLETPSEVRNIKEALDTYETIVNQYPQSIDWEKAKERVIYLKKFYFNIR
ncbi:MAG: hypothetical protein MSA27_01690 [Spirochaetia bacterium]|nr:hypothetical protein [Spirochaetia bacterium]